MSEIDATSPTTAATNLDANENDIVQDAVTPKEQPVEDRREDAMNVEATVDAAAAENADSEAETLIESPEKRKAAALLAAEPNVKAEPTETGEDVADKDIRSESELPSSDGKNRKRKRPDTDGPDGSRRVPSAPSSVLSSPSPEDLQPELSNPVKRKDRSPESSHKRQFDGDRHERSWDFDNKRRERSDGQIKIKKRRPSDVLTHDQKSQTTKQRQTSDNSERRETRSATYPRHSSEERSPSPRPSPRSHKRGQSIQSINTTSSINKSKRVPPPLNTRKRNRSEDRHSVSTEASGSPGPSIPNLRKFTSTDHEAISPAKQPMASVWGRRNRDQNGRTRLAKACADNKLELAKQRYEDRPEDLNIADNAGNTPLQIASLEGFVEIVDFLLSKQCEVDSKNIDKDTPLIDAVENGHLDVVQLLLEHGANPRMGNAKGDEPYELVPADDENYASIRALLSEARTKDQKRRRSDEQPAVGNATVRSSSRAASAASPRDSPPIHTPRSPPPSLVSRRRTGRSEQTRNDLLWQANTQENLQKLAAKGDSEGIVSVLSILEKAEPGALIAAARGGHDQALEFLIAMGKPDPDPQPIRTGEFKPGYNTPMLAAIGRGNLKVIELLLAQTGFNARKRDIKGHTYPDICKERKGERWEEEHAILKEAYSRTASPNTRKQESPKKMRDREKEGRRSSLSPTRSHRKAGHSPGAAHRERDNRESRSERDPGELKGHRSKDRERSAVDPTEPRKVHRTRRSQTDLPTLTPDGDLQKRRRLISGKTFHERRASQASHRSSSDNETNDTRASVRHELNKSKPLLKRSRDSRTPERQPSPESEASRDTQKKRRRVLSDTSPEEARTETGRPAKEPLVKVEAVHEDVQDAIPTEDVPMPDLPAGVDQKDPVKPADAEVTAKEEQKGAEELERERLAQEEADRERRLKEEEEARVEAERKAQAAAEAARVKAEQEAAAAEEKRLAELAAAEQLRQEAEAARKREEEERAERQRKEEEERAERQRKEEERQRRMEERRRREAEELERIRREALPAVLCTTAKMIDQGDPGVRDQSWLKRFLPLYTVHTRQIEPNCDSEIAEDEWIPNFQAAGLLAAKDLHLRQYTQLEKRPVNARERLHLWKVAGVMLSTDYDANAFNTTIERERKSYKDSEIKFSNMEALFWVRLSDFTDLIPLHSHLQGLNIKTQRIKVHPISLPLPEPSLPQTAIHSYPTGSHGPNGVLSNGITTGINGYHGL